MKLSLARASTVRLALQARGVDASRLLARASGTTAPVCGQQSESCRARERTVEFATLAPAKTASAANPTSRRPRSRPARARRPPPRRHRPPSRSSASSSRRGARSSGHRALANLDIVAGFMKATPASLEILGYADKTERGAEALARARAEAVRAYMVACGVSDKHLAVRAEPTGRPLRGARRGLPDAQPARRAPFRRADSRRRAAPATRPPRRRNSSRTARRRRARLAATGSSPARRPRRRRRSCCRTPAPCRSPACPIGSGS